mmetsp:Transcript_2419/g.3394  ORF Transcript_2419/g.3394 Transcript_2419/m.3394 type:complete len:111 (-) Transcript_2419:41-373(-)
MESSSSTSLPSSPIMMWICMLLAECVRGATFAIFWSTVLIHVEQISPAGSTSTMLTLMESIYRGLGHTMGSFLGGILISRVGGIAPAFWFVGWGVLITAILSTFLMKQAL